MVKSEMFRVSKEFAEYIRYFQKKEKKSSTQITKEMIQEPVLGNKFIIHLDFKKSFGKTKKLF